jgi:hypothetical protein
MKNGQKFMKRFRPDFWYIREADDDIVEDCWS